MVPGWRVGARGHWLWAAVTPTTTVYAICAGRGFEDAQAVLGADFDGVLVRDGWVVYRRYTNGEHQTCLQHLGRRWEASPGRVHPHTVGRPSARRLAGRPRAARPARRRRSERPRSGYRPRPTARPAQPADRQPAAAGDAERFAAHPANEFPAIFTFLWDPSVDATNWRAEQAIRPAVVIRNHVRRQPQVARFADTQQVRPPAVVRTARQRNLDLPALFAGCCAPLTPSSPTDSTCPAADRVSANDRVDARPTRG